MKKFSIIFFVLVCSVTTAIASNYETIKAMWTYPPKVKIAGFKLYLNNKLIKTFSDPNLREWTGKVLVKEGQNTFGITAYTTKGLESKLSNEVKITYNFNPPPIIFSNKSIKAMWTYPPKVKIAGFKLYLNNKLIKTFSDPNLREWTGKVLVKEGQNTFGITAYTTKGLESKLSNEVKITYDLTPPNIPVSVKVN